MQVRVFQKGFNFSQDGPGNRLVYHLQGCNLHCLWCANPEGIAIDGALLQKKDASAQSCPYHAIEDGHPDRERCTQCKTHPCTQVPGSGLFWSCEERETGDLLQEIENCSALFFDGGGVTFTGGEATVQFDALRELLQGCREKNIHTALESNAVSQRLPELFPLVDYLILDCKHYDTAVHKQFTGQGNEAVLKNIRLACEMREQLLLRIPLIGGCNASPQDAQHFTKLLTNIRFKGEVELLRYHEYGKQKWEQCGFPYLMGEAAVGEDIRCMFTKILRENDLRVIST